MLADMFMITLTGFIVVAKNTRPTHHEGKPIFESVAAAGKRHVQSPYHQFNKSCFRYCMSLIEQQVCIHVGECNNGRGVLSSLTT